MYRSLLVGPLTALRALLAFLALVAALPAQAAGGVAVIPSHVFNGAPGNSGVVGAALRASLEKQGFQVTPDAQVAAEMKRLQMDLTQPQPIAVLVKLRIAVGADYIVYPRILSVGLSTATQTIQAGILVNVAGGSTGSFVHTRQIVQSFAYTGPAPRNAVMPRPAADQAVAELLKGFYEKAKPGGSS